MNVLEKQLMVLSLSYSKEPLNLSYKFFYSFLTFFVVLNHSSLFDIGDLLLEPKIIALSDFSIHTITYLGPKNFRTTEYFYKIQNNGNSKN